MAESESVQTARIDTPDSVDSLLSRYTADPASPRPAEFRRLAADLIARISELDAENRRLVEAQPLLAVYRDRYILLSKSALADTTERKRAEDALRNSEAQHRAILAASLDAIITIDARGVIDSVNPATERLFGYTAVELIGGKVNVLMPPPYREMHDTYIENYLRTGERKIIGIGREVAGRRKDGSVFAMDLSVSELSIDGRKMFLGLVHDVTERKRAEESLRQTAEELARSNNDLAHFASVVSHDLQEPLRTVAGFVHLLQRKYHDRLDAEADSFIDFAVEGVKRMEMLIHDLLVYSRVGSGGTQPAPADARRALQTALDNLHGRIQATGAEIACGDLPMVRADATQLAQLLQNLIGNALKFRGAAPPKIYVDACRDGDCWRFSVRDNGIGIDAKFQERIFEIFQRLHTHKQYPGTGIGLAICEKIVDRHGGRIWVESEPGHGAVFHFSSPRDGNSGTVPIFASAGWKKGWKKVEKEVEKGDSHQIWDA